MKQFLKKVKGSKKSKSQASTRETSPTPLGLTLRDSLGPSTGSSNVYPRDDTNKSPENSSKTYELVCDWITEAAVIGRDVSEATPVLAPLKSTCLLIIRGLNVARSVHNNDVAWGEMVADIQPRVENMAQDAIKLRGKTAGSANDNDLLVAMDRYLKSIKVIMLEAKRAMEKAGSGTGVSSERVSLTQIDGQRIQRLREIEARAHGLYQSALRFTLDSKVEDVLEVGRKLVGMTRQVRKEGIWRLGLETSDDLEIAMSLASGSELEKCEPGTRVDILSHIRNWAEDDDAVEQIFWIKDAAGTGKSTVATTMAGEWLKENRLAGRFFFSPNVLLNKGIKYLCRTLILDLLDRFPSLFRVVEAELAASPEVYFDFRNQFRRLFTIPLELVMDVRSMVLVIDALDNCEQQDRQTLLRTLLEQLPRHPRLKVLLTSRPAPDIVASLANSTLVTGKDVQLHNVNRPTQGDIALYIHSRLSFFDVEERERIIRQSAGLFIWAATFCRAVGQSRLRARLLENLSHSQVTDPLDALYLSVLNQALIDIEAKPDLRKVLQVIISAFQPVSINSLISFLPKIYQINDFVQDLAGVIKDGHPDRPLKVLHPTFREFIVSDEERADGFVLELEPSHSLLAAACLDLLGRSLKYDIFGLRRDNQVLPQNSQVHNLDQIIASSTTPALRYASSYWTQHIVAAEAAWVDYESVTRFLCDHFLHWVELLSWQGTIGTAVSALAHLNLTLKRPYLATASLVTPNDTLAARHAHQFLTRCHSVIKDSALHTYSSPVELLPLGSPLRPPRSDDKRHRTLRILTQREDDWGSHTILTGHRSEIISVKLSPDASRAATVGTQGSFRLWIAETGENIGPIVPEVGLDFGVRYAEFSSDSLKVAFATTDGQLHLWDAQTGIPIWDVIREPRPSNASHICIRFSPSQQYVALALYDRKGIGHGYGSVIRFYDISTGKQLDKLLMVRDHCLAFDFSPDGRRCISNSVTARKDGIENGSLRLFDVETSAVLMEMLFIYGPGTRVDQLSAYSEDGTRIAIASGMEPFILLDGDTGERISMVDKDEPPSTLVRFAPRGEYMASIAKGPDITIWDKRNGKILQKIRISRGTVVDDVWFSQDMAKIAAHSSGEAIQVWELKTSIQLDSLLTGTVPPESRLPKRPRVVLSRDWTKALIQNSLDVNVYDLTIHPKAHYTPPKPGYNSFGSLTANPFIFVGSAGSDDTSMSLDYVPFAIWDASDGTPKVVASLGVMSSDSPGVIIANRHQEIVCHNPTKPIMLFSLVSYKQVHRTFERERVERSFNTYRGYAISPDESLIVAGCSQYIQVWEYLTGKLIWELTDRLLDDRWKYYQYEELIRKFIFSSDNTLLCITNERQLYVIEMSSDKWWGTRETALDPTTLAINSQKSHLAVGNRRSVILCRLTDKGIVCTHKVSVFTDADIDEEVEAVCVSFSSDGQYLVHGSRVWRVKEDDTLEEYNSHIIPRSLADHPFSFLTYRDGWIHSAFPPGPLVPIPIQQQKSFASPDIVVRWSACKNVVLAWEAEDRPTLWDVSHLVSHQYD